MRTTRFTLLAVLLTAVLSGCGHANVAGLAGAQMRGFGAPTVLVAGEERAFGFDLDRFQARFRDLAHATAPHVDTVSLPPQIDNRAYCSKVVDQGKLASCTAFALGKGLREFLQLRNGEHATPVSALWLYYNERVHMGPGFVTMDSGSTVSDGAWVLLHQGDATDASCPYVAPQFAVAPSALADATAPTGRVRMPSPVYELPEIKEALANKQAVAFGFKAYASIRKVGSDGLMPMPAPGEALLGGHAVLAVGYDDARQVLICKNSWGANWGDHGYFYMPYAFVSNTSYAMDFWTAQI